MTTERAEVTAERAKPLILMATDHVSESNLSLLIEASRSVGAGLLQWKGHGQTAPSRAPSLVVASLETGARRVPDDVAHLVTESFPRLPLLLLCNEPLLRPTMTAEAGCVTLLGPPLTRTKLAARLRMLLAGPTLSPPGEFIVYGESGRVAGNRYLCREMRQPGYWLSTFGSRDVPVPDMHRSSITGLSVMLSEPRSGPCELEPVAAALGRTESDESKELALSELLGGSRAALYLTGGAKEWIAYLPRRDWPLCLFSPVRLPHFTDLSRTLELSESCLIRLRAAPGDLLVALTADFGLWERAPARTALADGGPSLLEFVGSRGLEMAEHLSGAIVEVL